MLLARFLLFVGGHRRGHPARSERANDGQLAQNLLLLSQARTVARRRAVATDEHQSAVWTTRAPSSAAHPRRLVAPGASLRPGHRRSRPSLLSTTRYRRGPARQGREAQCEGPVPWRGKG